jgi:hypothetical protein
VTQPADILFDAADLPTLRKLRDAHQHFYDAVDGGNDDPDTRILRVNLKYTASFCDRVITRLEKST